jgi:hypothetical protein
VDLGAWGVVRASRHMRETGKRRSAVPTRSFTLRRVCGRLDFAEAVLRQPPRLMGYTQCEGGSNYVGPIAWPWARRNDIELAAKAENWESVDLDRNG